LRKLKDGDIAVIKSKKGTVFELNVKVNFGHREKVVFFHALGQGAQQIFLEGLIFEPMISFDAVFQKNRFF